MLSITEFDDSRAKTYRKRAEVLAYKADAGFVFYKKWGDQSVRQGGWIIIPLTIENKATNDIYGCDDVVFADTYEPSPSLRPNQYRKKEVIRAYQPGQPFTLQVKLSDGHTEVEQSKTDHRFDCWLAKNIKGEFYPIDDAEFKRTYIEVLARSSGYKVKSRDEHWENDGQPKRILALDGGGVRGVLTLEYLKKIEDILHHRHGGDSNFRLCHYFDLIAGTSTGAIIAACLAKGMLVSEVLALYQKFAQDVFKRNFFRRGFVNTKYDDKELKKHLNHVFRDNRLGSESLKTGLLVVTKRLDTGSIWPLSNNPKDKYFTSNIHDDYLANEDYPLKSVVRASTAAPSYFAPEYIEISAGDDKKPGVKGMFVDGGASPYNNPALLALQLVTLKGYRAEWLLDPDKLLMVSVGTGSGQPGASKSRLSIGHAVNSLLSIMDDCAESVELIMQWISDSPTAREIDGNVSDLGGDLISERPLLQYIRYNVQLNHKWLSKHLQLNFSEDKCKKLQEMDQPDNLTDLSYLGLKAANLQVSDKHFPTSFDLT